MVVHLSQGRLDDVSSDLLERNSQCDHHGRGAFLTGLNFFRQGAAALSWIQLGSVIPLFMVSNPPQIVGSSFLRDRTADEGRYQNGHPVHL